MREHAGDIEMTSTFDGLQRILQYYKEKIHPKDYDILRHTIDVIHTLQHSEDSHRIDGLIENRIIHKKRFQAWRSGRIPKEVDGVSVEAHP